MYDKWDDDPHPDRALRPGQPRRAARPRPRRLVGTTAPAPDLGYDDGPVPALFGNAKLVVQRTELAHVVETHPFQARFHQPGTYADLDHDRLEIIDGDVLLGPGVALLRAPGHTLGT
jgi:hypothetical protein